MTINRPMWTTPARMGLVVMTRPRDSSTIPEMMNTGPGAAWPPPVLTPLTSPLRVIGTSLPGPQTVLFFKFFRDVIPLPISVDGHKACSVNEDILHLRCHSFLSIFVTNVTYGRTASKVNLIGDYFHLWLQCLYFRELSFVMETKTRMPSPLVRTAMITESIMSCWTQEGGIFH